MFSGNSVSSKYKAVLEARGFKPIFLIKIRDFRRWVLNVSVGVARRRYRIYTYSKTDEGYNF
ncbi:hypothetical protein [Nostoc sp.]|uniref:hypothetical protein n=1 Tax=Nostoc sp. TaxID=1180 RepID=UPI002FFA884F